ncbi:hypothetical protein GKZ75_08800 [Kocuria indica]|uniref:Uncharacterized protein n=1 Tax=Kocuria marina subsp. indica TaxID=1049583 RepID=A0A6N9R0A2_9MICC|nr:hypothetical protein [Kocuria indica]NDO78317.1 hypothetical protein [Kocuria indica]
MSPGPSAVEPLSVQTLGDIGQSDAYSVSMPLQRWHVDDVGEVGFEERVRLGPELVLGGDEVLDGLGPLGAPLVKCGLDSLSGLCLGGRGDGELLVAVGDELFGDADGPGLPRARCLAGGLAGAAVRFADQEPIPELGIIAVGVEQRVRPVGLDQLRLRDLLFPPSVVGLAGEL